MILSILNKLVDRYFRKKYGVDIYVTGTINHMKFNVLVFPNKFLKKGEDYSEKYWNIVAHKDLLRSSLYSFFNLVGVNSRYDSDWHDKSRGPKEGKSTFDIHYVVADDLGEYMNEYIDKVCKLLSEFAKTDMLPEKFRQNTNEPDYYFTRGNVFFSPGEKDIDGYADRLMVDINSNLGMKNMVFGSIGMGYGTVSEMIWEYVYDHIEYDPQISFFIDGID
jgi:hypothetical protein